MQLLLVTGSWPLTAMHGFLDDEILYLARRFDGVVVAPMRPQQPILRELPPNVKVDTSLARRIERSWLSFGAIDRRATVLARTVRPSLSGQGFSTGEVFRDWKNPGWLRLSLLSRADSSSVALWAGKTQAPDIAYTFWLGAATHGLRRAWPRTPLASRVHGGDLFAEAHGWNSIPFQRAAIDSADLVASVSEAGRRYLVDKFPTLAHKLVLRRLGTPDVGPTQHPRTEALGILSVSNINANKRVAMIGRVAHALTTKGQQVIWTHLGDGPERASIEREFSGHPPSLTVRLRGQVPASEVARELTSGRHRVFVNLSLSEGAPVSVMEAQCAGLPVVATAVGGTPEVAPRHLNELVPTTLSVDEVAEAVLRASERPLGEFAERREYWARHYSDEANYPGWADELVRLASGQLRM